MKTKNELSRITVDIPKVDHKKLKAMAALTSRSMREIKGITEYKDFKELLKKLGI